MDGIESRTLLLSRRGDPLVERRARALAFARDRLPPDLRELLRPGN